MKRRAFTLVEIIISVAIFSLIIVYMTKATISVKNSNKTYQNAYEDVAKILKIKNFFYNDIFNINTSSVKLTIDKDENSVFCFQSRNSLFALVEPYICYANVNHKLIRYEKLQKFTLPLTYENEDRMHFNIILDKLKEFKVLANKNDFFVRIVSEEVTSNFEIILPYSREIIIVK